MKVNAPIAYLVSEYPAISHAFIYTEIQELRKKGLNIKPFSINFTKNAQKLQHAEQQEIQQTTYIKKYNPLTALLVNLKLLLAHPSKYFKMLSFALTLIHKGPKSIIKAIAYLIEAGILLHELQKEKITHVHNHFGNAAGTVALVASKSQLISYSMSIHGPTIFEMPHEDLLNEKVEGALFVRCISHFCKSQIMKSVNHVHWPKLNIVRCGIDLKKFEKKQKLPNPVPTILCVGRLCPQKGQHLLVEASHHLKTEGLNHEIIFVGTGPDETSLKKLVASYNLQDNIHFIGALGQQALLDYYTKADLFVLPTFAEGLPVVLMEAMAMHVPVVSTLVCGIPELINSQHSGLLVFPSDLPSLVLAIKKMLKEKQFSTNCTEAAYRTVASEYDIQMNADKLLNLFQQNLS